jgi:hypothetical protein
MLAYFNHFSIYHWFLLAVGVGMTAAGCLVNPDPPVAALPNAPLVVMPITESTNESDSERPSAPLVRDDIVYDGIFSDDLNGKGTITWPSQQVYRGDVRSGLPHGKGNMLFTNGRTYTGELNLG